MEYNKTKRGLEKGAAIFSVVMYALEILIFISIIVLGIIYLTKNTYLGEEYTPYHYYSYYYDQWVGGYESVYGINYSVGISYLVTGIVLLAFTIVELIISAKLIKSPLQADGSIKNRKGLRVTLLVFSILSGNLITAGLMIAVLCLKDVVAPKTKPELQQIAQPSVKQPAQPATSIEEKIAKLKEYKELGIIDDETYKKAVAKLIKEIM